MASLTTDPDGGDDVTATASEYGVGLYGMYKVAYWQRGHLSLLGGLDIVMTSSDTGLDNGDTSATDLLFGLGLHGEWFPTQYLSLFGQVGLRIDLYGEDEPGGALGDTSDGDNNDYSGYSLDLGADMLGDFGFTVWFQ